MTNAGSRWSLVQIVVGLVVAAISLTNHTTVARWDIEQTAVLTFCVVVTVFDVAMRVVAILRPIDGSPWFDAPMAGYLGLVPVWLGGLLATGLMLVMFWGAHN